MASSHRCEKTNLPIVCDVCLPCVVEARFRLLRCAHSDSLPLPVLSAHHIPSPFPCHSGWLEGSGDSVGKFEFVQRLYRRNAERLASRTRSLLAHLGNKDALYSSQLRDGLAAAAAPALGSTSSISSLTRAKALERDKAARAVALQWYETASSTEQIMFFEKILVSLDQALQKALLDFVLLNDEEESAVATAAADPSAPLPPSSRGPRRSTSRKVTGAGTVSLPPIGRRHTDPVPSTSLPSLRHSDLAQTPPRRSSNINSSGGKLDIIRLLPAPLAKYILFPLGLADLHRAALVSRAWAK
jgi:hypothetical protein